jgi:hypothetical protein
VRLPPTQLPHPRNDDLELDPKLLKKLPSLRRP